MTIISKKSIIAAATDVYKLTIAPPATSLRHVTWEVEKTYLRLLKFYSWSVFVGDDDDARSERKRVFLGVDHRVDPPVQRHANGQGFADVHSGLHHHRRLRRLHSLRLLADGRRQPREDRLRKQLPGEARWEIVARNFKRTPSLSTFWANFILPAEILQQFDKVAQVFA